MLYANVRPLPSDPVRGGNIVYLSGVQVLGQQNVPIESADSLRRLIGERDVRHVMFHSTVYPRRAVPVSKAEKWIAKLDRELAREARTG